MVYSSTLITSTNLWNGPRRHPEFALSRNLIFHISQPYLATCPLIDFHHSGVFVCLPSRCLIFLKDIMSGLHIPFVLEPIFWLEKVWKYFLHQSVPKVFLSLSDYPNLNKLKACFKLGLGDTCCSLLSMKSSGLRGSPSAHRPRAMGLLLIISAASCRSVQASLCVYFFPTKLLWSAFLNLHSSSQPDHWSADPWWEQRTTLFLFSLPTAGLFWNPIFLSA